MFSSIKHIIFGSELPLPDSKDNSDISTSLETSSDVNSVTYKKTDENQVNLPNSLILGSQSGQKNSVAENDISFEDDFNGRLQEVIENHAEFLNQQGRHNEAAIYYEQAEKIELSIHSDVPSADTLSHQINHLSEAIAGHEALPRTSHKFQDFIPLRTISSPEIIIDFNEQLSLTHSIQTTKNDDVAESSISHATSSQSLAIVQGSNNIANKLEKTTSRNEFGPIKVYLDQAEMYCQEKKWSKAIDACQAALAISPRVAHAYKLWGNILQNMGETTEAMGYYAKALVIDPSFPEVYANLGSLYAKQEQWEQAINYYQKAIELNPKFTGVYRNLAKIWRKLNNTEQYTKCLVHALSIDPSLGDAEEYYKLGGSLYEQGNLEEAIRCYRAAVELKPDFLLACNKLAELLEQQGDWKSAVTYYRQVLDIRSEKSKTNNTQTQTTSTTSHPLKTVSWNSNETSTYKETRRIHQSSLANNTHSDSQPKISSRPLSGIQELTHEIQEQPNSDKLRIQLGDLYTQTQEWEGAIDAYKSALRINPRLAKVYLKMANAFSKIGKQIEMAESFHRAFEIDLNLATPKQHLSLGNTFQRQGDLGKAIIAYNRATQISSDFSDAYRALGDVFKIQGEKDKALEAYQMALSANIDEGAKKKE